MHKTVLALGVASLTASPGCGSNDSDIAGKAIVTIKNETLTLDTGNNGTRVVNEDDDWGTFCGMENGAQAVFLMEPSGEVRFPWIWVSAIPDAINVSARIDGNDYNAVCHVTHTITSEEPYEADFSVEPCGLKRVFDDAPARLESAFFHVASCEEDGSGG
ncbi:hypothetical protein ACSRUE_19315 [Sorangium sp. KYC3313]|uniref:hypothetical protein n=1 Tax=Sorangium sp. KYC3313 TaxID=3449740 RepID=UPI003F8B7925